MIPGTDPVSAAAAAAPQSASQAMGGLDSDAFLQLMVAQLRYQNPMSPSDPTAMLQQTAQFTQVETMQKLLTTQQQLMGFQEVVLASSFVGREVTAETADGAVTGTVDGVAFTEAGPVLQIGDRDVLLDEARGLRATAPAAAPAPDPTPDTPLTT